MGDLGKNTIYGITETWLGDFDGAKLWEMNENLFFLCDRKSDFKERGGGVMLAVPKSLNPKERKDLNYLDKNVFKSIWIECRTTNSSATKNNQLNNISYNPHKHYYRQFSEEFSTSIDYAITENKPLVLMGYYDINFLNHNERESLETVLIPYGLYVMNKELPTRVVGTSKTWIDYIITDHLLVFSNIFERSLEKCVTKKKVFICNDRSAITIQNS